MLDPQDQLPPPFRPSSQFPARYERGSIILTSNKGVGEWGELPRRHRHRLGRPGPAPAPQPRAQIRVRATGSGRNARRGCSRRNSISPLRRRRPATTTLTDRVAGHQGADGITEQTWGGSIPNRRHRCWPTIRSVTNGTGKMSVHRCPEALGFLARPRLLLGTGSAVRIYVTCFGVRSRTRSAIRARHSCWKEFTRYSDRTLPPGPGRSSRPDSPPSTSRIRWLPRRKPSGGPRRQAAALRLFLQDRPMFP